MIKENGNLRNDANPGTSHNVNKACSGSARFWRQKTDDILQAETEAPSRGDIGQLAREGGSYV